MNIKETNLQGCFIVQPDVYKDNRGCFYESFNKLKLEEKLGYQINFVQDNCSVSKKGVLRGLHFQEGSFSQAKLIKVINGKVVDIVVDLRKKSPTFGQHIKVELSGEDSKMLFVPKGMAHGFLTLTDDVFFSYKCDNYYNKESERGIIFNDSDLKIEWGYSDIDLILSEKDLALPTFNSMF